MELLGLDLTSWLVASITVLITCLAYSSLRFSHFKGLGYPGPTPVPLFGTMISALKKGFRVFDTELIQRYGNFVATYEGRLPVLLIADVDVLKQIMVKDFDNFVNRRRIIFSEYPTRKMLTTLTGERWRHVRNAITPTFSAGKLKLMTAQINRCAADLADNLKEKASKNQSFELKKIAGDFTMDVIASTSFGLQINSQKEENSPFVKHAKEIFDSFGLDRPAFLILFFLPFLSPVFRLLRTSVFSKKAIDFFVDIVNRTLDQRKQSHMRQPDFIQLMIAAEKNGENDKADVNDVTSTEDKKALSHEEIVAQAMIFFVAGYDTTASTISFLAYNLALNPDVQNKLVNEVDKICGKDGDVTQEHINKMHYMEMVVQESMRLFPPLARMDRVASETITIDGKTIPKDTIVGIPIWYLHHDPHNWPDPEKFDPERFSQENKVSRNPFCYMPFGMGPRNCIGMRLALMEVKVALTHLLRRYKFSTCEETQIPLKFRPVDILETERGITLKVNERL